MISINFLKQRHLELRFAKKQDKKNLFYTGIFFVVCLIIFSITLAINIFYSNKLSLIKSTQTKLAQSLNQNKDQEIKYLDFSNKLKLINYLFQERKNKQEAIEFFSKTFGDDTHISQIIFEDAKTLIITLTSNDVIKLESIFKTLDLKKNSPYQKVISSSINRNPDATYELELVINLTNEN
jgi:hypothetical protein